MIDDALSVLVNLEHRGGVGLEENTGDGAGILFQIPHRFFHKEAQRYGTLLPREGKTVGDVLSALDAQMWAAIRWLPMEEVDVKLPRFETTTGVSLVEPMSALGMPSAFNPLTADIPDFCNIPQYISNMFQAAKIRVDEEGTEAAAITVIETNDSAMPDEPKQYEFHADRPFLYIISERSTSVIFFIGQYMGEGQGAPGPSDLTAPDVQRRPAAPVYDLMGRRLSGAPARGLYISDGRKMVR